MINRWSQKNKPDTLAEKKNSPSPASYNKQSEIVNDFINIIIIKLNYYY